MYFETLPLLHINVCYCDVALIFWTMEELQSFIYFFVFDNKVSCAMKYNSTKSFQHNYIMCIQCDIFIYDKNSYGTHYPKNMFCLSLYLRNLIEPNAKDDIKLDIDVLFRILILYISLRNSEYYKYQSAFSFHFTKT